MSAELDLEMTSEEEEEKPNILDSDIELENPVESAGFEGGFKINTDIDENK